MRIFKSTLALFMALLMVFALVGCSDKDPADNNTNKGAGGFKETEIVLDECKVVVVGAEQIVDYDENNGLTVYTYKDKKLIMLRYFRDKTQSEVAQILNVSQVQVSRLENKILTKIKNKIKD